METREHNAVHELEQLLIGAQPPITLAYDALGRRVQKTVTDSGGSATTTYALAGAQVVAEYEHGVLAREFVYGSVSGLRSRLASHLRPLSVLPRRQF